MALAQRQIAQQSTIANTMAALLAVQGSMAAQASLERQRRESAIQRRDALIAATATNRAQATADAKGYFATAGTGYGTALNTNLADMDSWVPRWSTAGEETVVSAAESAPEVTAHALGSALAAPPSL